MAFSSKSKKTAFSVSVRKVSFGLAKLTLCFPVLPCVGGKLLAEEQTFYKTKDFVTFFAAKCKQVQQLGIFTSEMVLYI